MIESEFKVVLSRLGMLHRWEMSHIDLGPMVPFFVRFRPILTVFLKYNSLPRPLCIVTDSTNELTICLTMII